MLVKLSPQDESRCIPWGRADPVMPGSAHLHKHASSPLFHTVLSHRLLIHLPRGRDGGIRGLLSIPLCCLFRLRLPGRMESGTQELMMNEIARRLGVTYPQVPGDQQECQDSSGLFISGALGMANPGGRQDWRACPDAPYFYFAVCSLARWGLVS